MLRIPVCIFEDNKPRRELLKLLLDGSDHFVCVGGYPDCRDVVAVVKRDKPSLVLMDVDMPHVNGIEGMRLVKSNFPDIKIIMQTVFDDDDKIFASMQAGADGYILKKIPPAKMLDSMLEVMHGGVVMTPSVAKQLLALFADKYKLVKPEFGLSDREIEVLRLLMKGFSYKMIAAETGITFATVNSHLKNIFRKLQVNSGLSAVAKAIEHNLI